LGRIPSWRDLASIGLGGATTQGLLADHTTAAREFPAVDPLALYPIVHGCSTYPSNGARFVHGQEFRLSSAFLAKETRHRQRRGKSHDSSKSSSGRAARTKSIAKGNARRVVNLNADPIVLPRVSRGIFLGLQKALRPTSNFSH
jgi:hypothetical protein